MFSKTRSGKKSSPLARVLIVLVLVLPVLGAAAYMWAMWDPKAYLRDIPLAVVSEDSGVGEGKEFTNYGDQIADGMLELDYLNFSKTSPEEASAKLERGEYMMVVTIPEDFSRKAATIIDEKPVKPNIHFELNDYYGTQSAFITGSLIPELQASVSQAVTAEYSAEVVNGLNEMSTGLGEASDGANQLDDGAGELRDGGAEAVDGIGQLKDGSFQLRDGAGQLRDGAKELSDGMDELRDGTSELGDGAGQIKDGVKELTDMLIPLLSEAQGPSQNLRPVVDVLRTTGMTAEADELEGLINDLNPKNPENLVAQLGALRDGTAELHTNLVDPNAPYLKGVLQLQDGAHQLRDGSKELADGTVELDDGMTELNTGAGELKDGMDQLKDGTNELSTGLRDGVAQAPHIAQPQVSSANMATPIEFTQGNMNPVQTAVSEEDPTATELTGGVSILLTILFGFLAMALLAMLLPAVLRRRKSEGTSHSAKGVIGGYTVLLLASLAALGLLTIVSTSMGWQPASWSSALLVLVLIAAAGAAVYQFLRTAFGHVAGGALIIATFVIGLFASGAVWPADATPAPLRFIHIIHPMGYARDAFIRASEGIYDGMFTRSILGLIVFVALGVVASVVVHRFRSNRDAKTPIV